MDANLLLKGPRAKIKRAYGHIDELRRTIEPLDPSLYTFEVEHHVLIPYANRSEYCLTYRPTEDIPEALSLIVGDTLNNIRSSLEYLASGIVRTVKPGAQAHFPIRRKREDLIAAPELAAIEKALPGSEKLLLNEIRPKDGPNEAAWAFASLNNDDKHNLLIPTVAAARILGSMRANNLALNSCEIRGNAAHELRVIASEAPIAVQKNVQIVVDVRFGQGNPFENEPVIPTLLQVVEVVAETLDAFEGLLQRTP